MNKILIKFVLLTLLLLTILACSTDDNSTEPSNYLELDIPDDFNWTNLDYINVNVTINSNNNSEKFLVYVKHGDKTLAHNFTQNNQLSMNVNSIKEYDQLEVTCPRLKYSASISTSQKEHNITIDNPFESKFNYATNVDPYFEDELKTDTSEFETIDGISPYMIASFMDNSNIYVPSQVPQANTGWYKYKYTADQSAIGDIQIKNDGILNYVELGVNHILMQTIDVEGYSYFNENLEGRVLDTTADIDDCPNGAYMSMFYIFMDENYNYLSSFPWPPWSYSDSDRFYSDRTENDLDNAKYITIIGQYNGPTGSVRLDNWLDTFYNAEATNGDVDGDGVIDSEDMYPYDANYAGRIDIPGGFMMFEDLWPDKGDYDFNDLYLYISDCQFTTNSENKITHLDVYYRILKYGASLHNGLGLRIIDANGSGDDITYQTIDTGNMIESAIGYSLPGDWQANEQGNWTEVANGDWSHMVYKDPFANNSVILIHDIANMDLDYNTGASIRIKFDPTQEQPENPIPDFFLFRSSNRHHEIHLAHYPPTNGVDMALFGSGVDSSMDPEGNWYKTSDNYPWALFFSNDSWVPAPKENIPIFEAYPDFSGWVTSGGENYQNWINNYDSELTENPWSK